MTDLIDVVQLHEIGGILYFYEIELSGGTIYLHPGVDETLADLVFDGNTYSAFPIEVTGLEINADGAINRPEMTVANVLSTWSDSLGGLQNKDLIGTKVTIRSTLEQHLSTSPTVEFPKKIYYIDRISGETAVSVSFELAAPFDVTGITIPGRTVVGKYCSWVYQGYDRSDVGGCIWRVDSQINIGGTDYKAYFTEDDVPIIPSGDTLTIPFETYTVYSAATAYAVDDYVEYDNTIWKCVRAGTGNTPDPDSRFWVRGDVCGKKLSSCKARFQFRPDINGNADVDGGAQRHMTTEPLPFGAFPGSRKFR